MQVHGLSSLAPINRALVILAQHLGLSTTGEKEYHMQLSMAKSLCAREAHI